MNFATSHLQTCHNYHKRKYCISVILITRPKDGCICCVSYSDITIRKSLTKTLKRIVTTGVTIISTIVEELVKTTSVPIISIIVEELVKTKHWN